MVQPQDLTEIVTGLRLLLDLKRIQQINSQNAIIVRDTPDISNNVGPVKSFLSRVLRSLLRVVLLGPLTSASTTTARS